MATLRPHPPGEGTGRSHGNGRPRPGLARCRPEASGPGPGLSRAPPPGSVAPRWALPVVSPQASVPQLGTGLA